MLRRQGIDSRNAAGGSSAFILATGQVELYPAVMKYGIPLTVGAGIDGYQRFKSALEVLDRR